LFISYFNDINGVILVIYVLMSNKIDAWTLYLPFVRNDMEMTVQSF